MAEQTKTTYPEHEKLAALRCPGKPDDPFAGHNRLVGAFLEWLEAEGYSICRWQESRRVELGSCQECAEHRRGEARGREAGDAGGIPQQRRGEGVMAWALLRCTPDHGDLAGEGRRLRTALDELGLAIASELAELHDRLTAIVARQRGALQAIVDHPCPTGQADCTCGPGETSMRGIARAALEGER